MSHTPTPWSVCEVSSSDWFTQATISPEGFHTPILAVCTDKGNYDKSDATANADHIVRCVNAHEALVAIVRKFVDADYDEIDRTAARNLLKELQTSGTLTETK